MMSIRTLLTHWSDDLLGVPRLLERLLMLRSHPDVPAKFASERTSGTHLRQGHPNHQAPERLCLPRVDGGVSLRMRPVDLDRIFLDSLEQARRLPRGHRLELGTVETSTILGDRDLLGELLLILMRTALRRASRRGRMEASIKLTREQVVVAIRLSGAEIRPEELCEVYERFDPEDPDQARLRAETGVNLTVASWIAEQHGGAVSVSTKQGSGVQLAVTLPVRLDPESLTQIEQAVLDCPSSPSKN